MTAFKQHRMEERLRQQEGGCHGLAGENDLHIG
jgi:hypothetical protein